MTPDREKVINGLRDIDMFIAGRLGYEKAKNFLRTIDEAVAMLKEQEVVRCKNCKKYGDNKKCPIEALITSDSKQFFAFDENWYCADGEHK